MSIDWQAGSDFGGSSRPPTIDNAASDDRALVERRLRELVASEEAHPQLLHRAMHYSLRAGGKRFRPMLTLRVARELGAPASSALDPACAIEMVHTASLILDDLPCMDDASLRRGKAANHRVFGEDTAILAATALLNRSFGVIAECEAIAPSVRLELVRLLSDAVGSDGIIAGQFCDLRGDWRGDEEVAGLKQMYAQKTGALFVAAVEAGARVARVEPEWVRAVREFAVNLGLAFQILDDLLDVYGRRDEIGKDTGKDRSKVTLVSRLGAGHAHLEVERHVRSAELALEPLGEAGVPLVELANSCTRPTLERVTLL